MSKLEEVWAVKIFILFVAIVAQPCWKKLSGSGWSGLNEEQMVVPAGFGSDSALFDKILDHLSEFKTFNNAMLAN